MTTRPPESADCFGISEIRRGFRHNPRDEQDRRDADGDRHDDDQGRTSDTAPGAANKGGKTEDRPG